MLCVTHDETFLKTLEGDYQDSLKCQMVIIFSLSCVFVSVAMQLMALLTASDLKMLLQGVQSLF